MRKDLKREFLFDLFPENSIGAEIGVWKGQFSARIIKIVKPKRLFLIDPWRYRPDQPHRLQGHPDKSQKYMNVMYRRVRRTLGVLPEVKIIRAKSHRAARTIRPNLLDWAYIDGDHDYDVVKRDIDLYYRRVKPGGILCGDDLNQADVAKAVIEMLGNHDGLTFRTDQWFVPVKKGRIAPADQMLT